MRHSSRAQISEVRLSNRGLRLPVPSAGTGIILWLLAYVLLAGLLFSQAWATPGVNEIGSGVIKVDARLATWFLAWTPYALTHGLSPLFSGQLDYPTGINLMWNTSFVFPSLVLSPITMVFGPVVAYNTLTTLALSISAWCAYLAVRSLVSSQLAAGLAGLLYGFSPFMIDHALGQPSVLLLFYPPIVILLLHEILVRQRRSSLVLGIWLGLATAAQLLTSEEVLATTVIFAAIATLLLAALNRRLIGAKIIFAVRSLAAALAVFILLAAYPLWMQFFGPQAVSDVRPDKYVTNLLAFVVPTRLQMISTPGLLALSQHFTTRNFVEESGAYLGLPLLLLALAVAIAFRSRRLVQVTAAIGIIVGLLALGPALHIGGHLIGLPLPGRLIEDKPLLDSVVPPRLVPYIDLMVAVLFAVFVAACLSAANTKLRIAGCAAAVVALLPLLPALPYPAPPAYTPPFFLGGDVRRIPAGQVILVAPFSREFDAEAMLWQAQSGMRFRMPEGYGWRPGPTRDPPPSKLQDEMGAIQDGTPVPALTDELRGQILADLRRSDVQAIVVGPVHAQADMVAMFTAVLGRAGEYDGGVYVWWHL